jgi:16S rRNA (uracil1498-N3)-methyltransferase
MARFFLSPDAWDGQPVLGGDEAKHAVQVLRVRRGDRIVVFDVQKAVELGVTAIQPLITRHTVVQVGEDDASRKSAKWQRVALEACKQCGQDHLPEVLPTRDFRDWLRDGEEGVKILGSLFPGARPLREILRAETPPHRVVLLIGPEGDFSPDEGAAALEAGFQPARFGSIILRSETAAFFGISAVRYEFPGVEG